MQRTFKQDCAKVNAAAKRHFVELPSIIAWCLSVLLMLVGFFVVVGGVPVTERGNYHGGSFVQMLIGFVIFAVGGWMVDAKWGRFSPSPKSRR